MKATHNYRIGQLVRYVNHHLPVEITALYADRVSITGYDYNFDEIASWTMTVGVDNVVPMPNAPRNPKRAGIKPNIVIGRGRVINLARKWGLYSQKTDTHYASYYTQQAANDAKRDYERSGFPFYVKEIDFSHIIDPKKGLARGYVRPFDASRPFMGRAVFTALDWMNYQSKLGYWQKGKDAILGRTWKTSV